MTEAEWLETSDPDGMVAVVCSRTRRTGVLSRLLGWQHRPWADYLSCRMRG